MLDRAIRARNHRAGRRTKSLLLAALSLGALAIATSAQDLNSDEALPSDPPAAPEPMAGFARMEAGEWRLCAVPATTWIHATTWRWGPGRHSIRAHRVGSDIDGNPWRELVIYYWRQDRQKIHMLSFHPDIPGIGRGVGEGTFEFDGETAAATLVLHQPRARRKLASRWTFDGQDKYHEELLEDSGRGQIPLAEWDYARSMEPSESPPTAPGGAPTPSKNIQAFVTLLGQWKTTEDGGEIIARSNFEWMEHLDVVALRVEATPKPDEPGHLLDAYFYHHVGSGKLRCLALSASGGVYKGGVTVLEDRGLELDLMRYEGKAGDRRLVRFEFESDGTLRTREWSIDGDDRTLAFDAIHHRTSEPQEN